MTTYSIEELADETGVDRRTIRRYIGEGLVPRPELRGPNTTYDEVHRLSLLATARLRREGHGLVAIRAQVAERSLEQLAVLAGLAPAAPPAAAIPAPAPGAIGAYRAEIARGQEKWERLLLCPGVELHVRSEADAEAWRVAREIAAVYGKPPSA